MNLWKVTHRDTVTSTCGSLRHVTAGDLRVEKFERESLVATDGDSLGDVQGALEKREEQIEVRTELLHVEFLGRAANGDKWVPLADHLAAVSFAEIERKNSTS